MKKLSLTLLLFLGIFLLLFTIFDYSMHSGKLLSSKALSTYDLTTYFICQWILRIDVLLPLALMLAALKIYFDLSENRELVAFQAGGISKKALATPLLLISLFCSFSLLASFEWLYPLASKKAGKIQMTRRMAKDSKFRKITLDDGSKLLFNPTIRGNSHLEEVIWIKSPSDFWKIEKLDFEDGKAFASQATHFLREDSGKLARAETIQSGEIKNLNFTSRNLKHGTKKHEELSLSSLFKKRGPSQKIVNAEAMHKISISMLPMLVGLFVASISMRFARHQPHFLILALSIAGFITCIMLDGSGQILAKSGRVSAEIALLMPMTLLILFFGTLFFRLEKKLF